MKGNGYLAIWSDLAPEDETDWAHWITREHAAERVGIAGFLACRIFRAIGTAANRYFIRGRRRHGISGTVELTDAMVAKNHAAPSDFFRGGGRVAASAGLGQGEYWPPCRIMPNLNGMLRH